MQKAATTTLTIRNVEPRVKEQLRVRAALNGRSMEAELRDILKQAVAGERPQAELSLSEAIRRRFLPFGGVEELEPHPPVSADPPASFDR